MTDQGDGRSRLILHVGTHKTGTSYLQKLFLQHRHVLAEACVGLATPVDDPLGSHHLLVSYLDQDDDHFQRFLAGLNSGFPTTLLSSECLLPWLMKSARAPRLAALLAAHYDVTVVLFLRRQDHMRESVFAEVASSWYQGTIHAMPPYDYNYLMLVERLVELFGIEALRLGLYRDDRRQDLAADFLTLAGLERLIGRLAPIPRERVSANRRQLALLALFPKDNPARFERMRRAVLAPGVIAADSSKYQQSPEQRRLFLEVYLASNRRLARVFRPDAEDYLTDISARQEDWSPPAPYTPAEVAALLSQLAAGPTSPSPIGLEALDATLRGFVESCRWLVLLHDGALQSAFVAQLTELCGAIPTVLDGRWSHPSALAQLPPSSRLLDACLDSDLARPFLDVAAARGMPVQPVGLPRDGGVPPGSHRSDDDRVRSQG